MNTSQDCINIGVFEWKPHVTIRGEPGNQTMVGTMIDLWDVIAEHLGFCYRPVLAPDLTSGARLPNGTWTGLIGLLDRKKIDIIGLGLGMTEERLTVLQPSEFLYWETWTAGYIRPRLDSDVTGFIKPLTSEVWLGLLFSSLAAFGVATCVRLIESDIFSLWSSDSATLHGFEKEEESPRVLDQSFQSYFNDAGLWTIAPLLSQSISSTPRGDVVRFLCLMWLLMTLTVGSVYRGNLKAKLILPKITIPFDNFEELEDTGIPFWTPKHSTGYNFIKTSPMTSTFGRLQNQLVEPEGPVNIKRAIQGMINGDHALVAPRSAIVQMLDEAFSKSGRCINYIMSQQILGQGSSVSFGIGSPWKHKLNKVIVRLREAGIIDHIQLKGVSNATECLKPISTKGSEALRPMALGDFYGALAIYAGGVAVAFASFAAEIFFRVENNQSRPHSKVY